MTRGFQPQITIKEAIEKIDSNIFVLPAIQRKFVWEPSQIELLFDSIMRKYPINSLMVWEINSSEIKNNYKFYSFLRKFVQKYGEMNEAINTKGRAENFYAVIDGQQRLNSLYLGLKGTYALKIPHRSWTYMEDNFPPMKLYLNIKSEHKSETDIDKAYEFKFLKPAKALSDNQIGEKFWFEVGDILMLEKPIDQFKYLQGNDLADNEYAAYTLDLLSTSINQDRVLNYFVEDEQDEEKVLDIFIRTNDGGTKLTFSDLLMSVLTSQWPDARERVDELIKEVNQFGEFTITTDFVLKTTLVLFSDDIRNRVKNFDDNTIQQIITEWPRIRQSIVGTFELIYRLGFNNKTFPAKNAAIPLVAWVYRNELENQVIKYNFYDTMNEASDSAKIKKWLIMVFLKRIFGGQSDSILLDIKRIIESTENKGFPLEAIIDSAKGNPGENYTFDNEVISSILESQCGSDTANFVLSLFYPNLDYYNQNFHIDHIHPKTEFINSKKALANFTQPELDEISDNWNKVGNLQLLNGDQNISKNDGSLVEWVRKNKLTNDFLFVDPEISLELTDFQIFYQHRVEKLKKKLALLLS